MYYRFLFIDAKSKVYTCIMHECISCRPLITSIYHSPGNLFIIKSNQNRIGWILTVCLLLPTYCFEDLLYFKEK